MLARVAHAGPVVLIPLGLSPVAHGLALGALSGVAGIAGFLAALGLRARPLDAYGVRRTTLYLPALVVGLVAGELRRRSGSIWPGSAAHAVSALGPAGLA